jgi:hypothetical protein
MNNILLDYAVDNTWCNPEQDRHYNIRAAKISPHIGVVGRIKVMGNEIFLPTKTDRYHVFYVGDLNPLLLSLLTSSPIWSVKGWKAFANSIETNDVMIDIFTAGGEQIPKFDSFYKFTPDNVFIFCVPVNNKLAMNFHVLSNTGTIEAGEAIYLRAYRNQYYDDKINRQLTDGLIYRNYLNITDAQRYQIQNEQMGLHPQYLLKTISLVNGYRVPSVDMSQTKRGDTVEFVFDSSIIEKRRYQISTLRSFHSALDNTYKYLIHDPSLIVDDIKFIDDMDVYIGCVYDVRETRPNGTVITVTRDKSYYMGRTRARNARMVTHRDYCIDYLAVSAISNNLKADIDSDDLANLVTPLDVKDFYVELIVRDSYPIRYLVKDNNRIFEMYKLPKEKIIDAMIGLRANVDVWKASNLEKSAYTRHMGYYSHELTPTVLQHSFGYNSISQIVGDTPMSTQMYSGQNMVLNIPPQLRHNATAYEYDINGYFLGVYHHNAGASYACMNTQTKTVEMLSGRGTSRPDVKFGVDNIPISVGHNTKVYCCSLVAGVPNNNWVDITDTNDYFIDNDVLKYNNLSNPNRYLAVISDKDFLMFETTIVASDGTLSFVLSQEENRNGTYTNVPLTIPYGQLDIILNDKHSLIHGIDYTVDFPNIIIHNKKYLKQSAISVPQKVHVRFYGFCTTDMKLDPVEDTGFVKHGYLSDDVRFNLREDKVNRIIVDGRLMRKDQIEFGEHGGLIRPIHALNGLPYQVKDIVVPMKDYIPSDTYSLRKISMDIDIAVENYLSEYMPTQSRGHIFTIVTKHNLFSNYFGKIIDTMAKGFVSESLCASLTRYPDILNHFSSYNHMLEKDIINCMPSHYYDFVIIHPHCLGSVVNLGPEQYRVLQVLVSIYGKNMISLASSINISV